MESTDIHQITEKAERSGSHSDLPEIVPAAVPTEKVERHGDTPAASSQTTNLPPSLPLPGAEGLTKLKIFDDVRRYCVGYGSHYSNPKYEWFVLEGSGDPEERTCCEWCKKRLFADRAAISRTTNLEYSPGCCSMFEPKLTHLTVHGVSVGLEAENRPLYKSPAAESVSEMSGEAIFIAPTATSFHISIKNADPAYDWFQVKAYSVLGKKCPENLLQRRYGKRTVISYAFDGDTKRGLVFNEFSSWETEHKMEIANGHSDNMICLEILQCKRYGAKKASVATTTDGFVRTILGFFAGDETDDQNADEFIPHPDGPITFQISLQCFQNEGEILTDNLSVLAATEAIYRGVRMVADTQRRDYEETIAKLQAKLTQLNELVTRTETQFDGILGVKLDDPKFGLLRERLKQLSDSQRVVSDTTTILTYYPEFSKSVSEFFDMVHRRYHETQ